MPRISAFRVRIAGAGLLVFLLSLPGCGGDYRGDGIASFEARRFNEAADRLRIALSQNPDDIEVKYLLAVALREADRTGEAATLFEQLIAVPEYHVRAANQVVRTLLKAERIEDARARLKRALEQDPDDIILLEAMGEVEFAEYRVQYAKIEEFLKNHVGRRALPSAAGKAEILITVESERYASAAENYLPRLKDLGVSDLESLNGMIEKAREELAEAERLFRRVIGENSGAFRPRVTLGRIAYLRRNIEDVESLLLPVARMKETDIEDPDLRTQLRRSRFIALGTIMDSLRRAGLRERALTLTEEIVRELPSVGSLAPNIATLLFETEQYEKLDKLARQWHRNAPRNPYANFYRGFLIYREGRYQDALNYLERAVSGAQGSALFNKYLGLTLLEVGSFQRASNHLQTALKRMKRDAELYIATARALEELGDVQGATKILTRALIGYFRSRRRKGHDEIQQALTRIYERVGKVIDTVEDARRAYAEDPKNPLVALQLAQMELEEGNLQTADQLARDVIAESPDLPDAWLVKAHVQMKSENWKGALQSLETVERLHPGDAAVAWSMARAHLALRRYDEARAAARLSLDREADLAGPALVLLETDLAERKFADAETRGRSLLERFPKEPKVVAAVANSLSAQRKWTEAVTFLRRLRELEPEDPRAALDLGRALLASDKSSEATQPLLEAATLAKDDIALREEIAKVLSSAGQLEAAITTLEDLVRTSSRGRRARIADRLMVLHNRARNYLRVLELAVELRRAGGEADALRRLITMEHSRGAYDEAASAVRVLQSIDGLSDARRLPKGMVDSLLRIEAWAKVRDLVTQGIREKRLDPDEYAAALARAAFGRGRSVEAEKLITSTLPRAEGRAQADLYAVWLGWLVDSREREKAMATAKEAVARHARDARLRRLAAKAAMLGASYDQAETHLATIERHQSDEVRLELAALRVLRRGYTDALDALRRSRSPEGRTARAVLGVLADKKKPGSRGLPGYLSALGKRRFDEAMKAAATVTELPATMRSPLAALAQAASGSPEDAGLLSELIGRSYVIASSGILRRSLDRELEQAAGNLSRHEWFLRHWRAWVLLRYGQGKAAAKVAVPLLAAGKASQPLTVFLAAHAALLNAGTRNVRRVVEGIYQEGDLPGPLARDLSDLMRSRDDLDQASRYLIRNPKPGREDHERRIMISWETGEYQVMRESLAQLPPDAFEDPALQLARLAFDTSDKGKASLKARLLEDEPSRRVDPLFRLWASTWLSDPDVIAANLRRALAVRPYDSWHMERILQMLARSGAPRELRTSLETGLTVLDPFADIRRIPPQRRRRASW